MTAAAALRTAAAFGLAVHDARVSDLPGGYSNDLALVETPAGAHVVRRYGRLHVTRRAVLFEHAVAAAASARMPEVVAPLAGPGGATLLERDGAMLAIYPYVPGTAGRRDRRTAHAAAGVLARFHRALSGSHVAGGTRTTRFLGILPWLRERFLRLSADPRLVRSLDWNVLIAAVTAAAARVAPHAKSLPHAIVHGDPNPGNVITAAPGDVRALIDLDFAHESERIYDVGALLDEFAREHDDAPLDVARIAPLLAAYAEEAPVSGIERALLPEAMLRRAATLTWYVTTRHDGRVPGDVGGAHRYAARVAEIVAGAAEIRAEAERT